MSSTHKTLSLSLSLSLSKALLLAKAQTHAHKKKPALLLLLLKLSPKSGTLSDKKVFNRCFSLDGRERIALFFLFGGLTCTEKKTPKRKKMSHEGFKVLNF